VNVQVEVARAGITPIERKFGKLVNPADSTVSPRVFSDPELYRLEGERVFGRAWLYVGHEADLAEPNSFVTNYMGEEGVIVTRARSKIRVFINSCRHRGMRLCRLELGVARTFRCPYHGWTFSNEGKLVGIPEFEPGYHNDLDAEKWGLIEVPRVETFRGLIFACYDADAVSLWDYLGDAKWYLDLFLNRNTTGMKPLPGVAKTRWSGNWKFGAEQLGGDNSHAIWAHNFLVKLGLVKEFGGVDAWSRDFQVKCNNGHGFILLNEDPAHLPPPLAAYRAEIRQQAAQLLDRRQLELIDTVHVGTIFPNFSFIEFMGSLFVRVWHPRGVHKTEMWTWLMTEKDAPPEITAIQRDITTRNFGPAGTVESDDNEMWVGCSEPSGGLLRKQVPLNYAMSHGFGKAADDGRPGLIHRTPTEIAAFGFHEQWNAMMQRE
jgi:phenylpropionate dioxygenase-like ring-hydroxylating dioxygenase large terminal subunit